MRLEFKNLKPNEKLPHCHPKKFTKNADTSRAGISLTNQKLNWGEAFAGTKAIYQTSKPNKKRKGQTFKTKSNSLCQSRADLQLLKATPSTQKRNEKNWASIIFCRQQRKLSNEKLYETKALQLYFIRKMKFLFALPTTNRACRSGGNRIPSARLTEAKFINKSWWFAHS